jgi:hypothetical protein
MRTDQTISEMTEGDLVDTDARAVLGASPAAGSRYSWVEGYLERLHGKERREEYYARLGQERPSGRKG